MSMGIRRHKTAPSWSGDILGISWDRLISPNKLWGATPFRHLICVYIGEKNHLWWTDDSKPNPFGQKWRARSKVGYLSSFIHAFTQNGSEICRLLRVTSLSTTNEPVGKRHFWPQKLLLWKAFQNETPIITNCYWALFYTHRIQVISWRMQVESQQLDSKALGHLRSPKNVQRHPTKHQPYPDDPCMEYLLTLAL